MSRTENEIIDAINEHDSLVRRCSAGEIDFWSFILQYNNFYQHHALDGHESSEEELTILSRLEPRVLPHRLVASDVLAHVCSDHDAANPSYQAAGRFGSSVAVDKIRAIASTFIGPGNQSTSA